MGAAKIARQNEQPKRESHHEDGQDEAGPNDWFTEHVELRPAPERPRHGVVEKRLVRLKN